MTRHSACSVNGKCALNSGVETAFRTSCQLAPPWATVVEPVVCLPCFLSILYFIVFSAPRDRQPRGPPR
ncbi:hypothetical protein BDV24DRAFT_128508 [Aspergillus arachidicola]|uniref:Uncharacterized protein n=1 Tax=Aspergillus arachidicola TaxID=656916 RepID=A0A5N6YEB4_9EURO|nr:hypothetical protein BDV24DRAFT_128508 [Aspergillus arachidicola]